MNESEHTRLEDIDMVTRTHPVIKQLQASLISAKPLNTLHFIKKWAQGQIGELMVDDDSGEEQDQTGQKYKAPPSKEQIYRRRGAIVMARSDENEHWNQFILKHPMPKNEESKSRIMLSLREIPFLKRMGWDDINYLEKIAEMREYYRDEVFVRKGQTINRVYIIVQGQIKRPQGMAGTFTIFCEGQCLFVESLLSLFHTSTVYTIASDTAWICGIESYSVYELMQKVNRREQEFYQKILMGVGLFSCLDSEEMYKLICMVKKMPLFKIDDIVLERYQKVGKLFLVLSGQFLSYKRNISGQITSFLTFREGQYFGEEWLMGEESECAVRTRTEGTLAYIDKSELQAGISSVLKLALRKKQKRLNI